MQKTIFEKIIDREIPADIIYEDDICIAFLDIFPVKKGHVLLCSKKPYPWIQDVPTHELGQIMEVGQSIIKNMKSSLTIDYVQVGIVGTEIPHFHVHLIPHLFSDKVETSYNRPVDSYTSDEERLSFVDRLKM